MLHRPESPSGGIYKKLMGAKKVRTNQWLLHVSQEEVRGEHVTARVEDSGAGSEGGDVYAIGAKSTGESGVLAEVGQSGGELTLLHQYPPDGSSCRKGLGLRGW